MPYTLTFRARASAARTLSVDAGMAQAPWSGLGFSANVPLTTAWKTFTFTFTVNQSFSNARINFGNMGLGAGTVWLAGVSLKPGGLLGCRVRRTARHVQHSRVPAEGRNGRPHRGVPA